MNRSIPMVALALVACSTQPPGAPPPTDTDRGGSAPALVRGLRPAPPDSLPGWTLVERETEALDVGVFTRFRRDDGLQVDTYLYPVPWPEAVCPVACVQRSVDREADDFRDVIAPRLPQLGSFAEVRLASDEVLPSATSGMTDTRHLSFEVVDRDGREGFSEFLVAGAHGYRLKLRMTDFSGVSSRAVARAAFAGFADGVRWPYECRFGAATTADVPALDTHFDQPVRAVARAIDSVLAAGPHELKSRSGAWVGAPRFEWPEAMALDDRPAGQSPGYQLLVMLRERSDSTFYSVAAPVVCNAEPGYDAEGDGLAEAFRRAVANPLAAEIRRAVERADGSR